MSSGSGAKVDGKIAGRLSFGDVETTRGKLGFTVELDEQLHRVWFRTDAPIVPNGDAILATTLLPAMVRGDRLDLPLPVSPRLLTRVPEVQNVLRTWQDHFEWPGGRPRQVKIAGPERPLSAPEPVGVAAFFSGGVDSFSTILEHPEITHLIWLEGFDIPLELTELSSHMRNSIREAALELGKQLIVIETNARTFADPRVPWGAYHGTLLAAAALLVGPLFSRVYIASTYEYRLLHPWGSHPRIDILWSTEQMQLVHDGTRYSRTQKIERVADHPTAQRTLRVCWQNTGTTPNCGRCAKCVNTMVVLESMGILDRFRTFPSTIDFSLLAVEPPYGFWWREHRELARSRGCTALVEAIDRVRPLTSHLRFRPEGVSSSVDDDKSPLVGVVIPAYRQSQFLAGAAMSALKQEGPIGVGVVIVNDGCPYPSTAEIAETLRDAYPCRVEYLSQENFGLSAARNAGIRRALETWPSIEAILPLDADDLLLPSSVADLWFALQRNAGVDWVTPQMEIFGDQDIDWAAPAPLTLYRQLIGNQCHASSLIRRNVFDHGLFYDESMRSGYEDWEFYLRAMSEGYTAAGAGRCGFLYRRRTGSMFHAAQTQHESVFGMIKERHSALYRGRALTALEHQDAPRFAIVLLDRQEVLALSAVDLPPRRISLPEFKEQLDAGAGGVLPTGSVMPPVTLLTTSTMFQWLTDRALLPGALLRLQEALSRQTCVGIAVGSDGEPPAAVGLRTGKLFETISANPGVSLPAETTIFVSGMSGGDETKPPPLDEAAAWSALVGPRARTHRSRPPMGFETLSSLSLIHHVEKLDTTFPWAGTDGAKLNVWVLQPWFGYAGGSALQLVLEAQRRTPGLKAHLLLTGSGQEDLMGEGTVFETITSIAELEHSRASALITQILRSAEVVVNAGSAAGYQAMGGLTEPVTRIGFVSEPWVPSGARVHPERLCDVFIVPSSDVRRSLTTLEVPADKILEMGQGEEQPTLLEAIGLARRWVAA